MKKTKNSPPPKYKTFWIFFIQTLKVVSLQQWEIKFGKHYAIILIYDILFRYTLISFAPASPPPPQPSSQDLRYFERGRRGGICEGGDAKKTNSKMNLTLVSLVKFWEVPNFFYPERSLWAYSSTLTKVVRKKLVLFLDRKKRNGCWRWLANEEV